MRHNGALIYSLVPRGVTLPCRLISRVVMFGLRLGLRVVCVWFVCGLWRTYLWDRSLEHIACSVLNLSFRLIRLGLLVFVPLSVCCGT